ncbi:hypothetical protein X751_31320 [Mesorhizobium sp. LNJC395A00]|nr:hypothetical protein X757_16860 [Mesorhizobium sp. LSHC414A00]ESY09676.1 hypothetical protein X751_31320 [Mesorhizobium sp. LNJC395A00]
MTYKNHVCRVMRCKHRTTHCGIDLSSGDIARRRFGL